MKKISFIVFIILLLVIAGELGYYFILNTRTDKLSNVPPAQPTSTLISPQVTKNPNPLIKDEAVKTIITTLNTLTRLRKSEAAKIYYLSEFDGFIGDLIPAKGRLFPRIKIVDKNNQPVLTIFIPPDDYKSNNQHLLFKIVNGIKTPISFNEAKIGDHITYTIKFDIVNNKTDSSELVINNK